MIVKDSRGNELLEMIDIAEDEADKKYAPINHALAVVKVGDDYIMGYNHWRKDWEIFGGCREQNESIRACIIRECREELGIYREDYTYLGLMKYYMAPGYFNPDWHIEYGGLYGITLPGEAIEEIYRHRSDKREIERLEYYRNINKGEVISEIDKRLLRYWD